MRRGRGWWLWQQHGDHKRISPLTLRILAVNSLALIILVGTILYLGRYQDRLVQTGLEALRVEARIFANALGEGAVIAVEDEREIISPDLARIMVRRLVEASDNRTRLYDQDGTLLVDSRILSDSGSTIQIEQIETIDPQEEEISAYHKFLSYLIGRIPQRSSFPLYREISAASEEQYDIVRAAQRGEIADRVWKTSDGGILLSVAVPVQRYKHVLGSLLVTRSGKHIERAVDGVRLDVIRAFCGVLLITVLMSLYLGRTIVLPVKLLADAVEDVRSDQAQARSIGTTAGLLSKRQIPDLSSRGDEIGELSVALRATTQALAIRVAAIENFAADVAHEIKNPLTSLRSAVEAATRVKDPMQQRKLMTVIRDDVDRLDRLISDIASFSRLDAELGRAQARPIDIGKMITSLVDIYHAYGSAERAVNVVMSAPPPDGIMVNALEERLVEVLRNLIDNAISFSPAGTAVEVSMRAEGGWVVIAVEDNGPGIPENRFTEIFDRFYSERPRTEKFGMHSGLGLSIAKQIVEAHHGMIWAENRKNADGAVCGARFTVKLPRMAMKSAA